MMSSRDTLPSRVAQWEPPQDFVTATFLPPFPLPRDYKEYEIAKHLWLYISPVLLVFGCLGNTLSLLVLRSSKMKNNRCSLSLSVLSVVDTVVLCTGLLRQWILQLGGVDLRTLSEAGCKIHMFLTYYSSHLSSWTLLLVAVERLVSVCSPIKAQRWCRRRNLVIWGCVTAIALCCINAPVLWFVTLVDYSDVEIGPQNLTFEFVDCLFKEEYREYGHDVLYWLDFVLLCMIPFIVIFPCNMAIIIKVSFGRPETVRAEGAPTGRSKIPPTKRMSSVTATLVLVCVVFLITTVPLAVYFLGIDVWFSEKTSEAYAKTLLIYTVVNLIYYISNAINFMLYCLAGSVFRQAALALFCKPCCRKRPERRSWRDSILQSVAGRTSLRNDGGSAIIDNSPQVNTEPGPPPASACQTLSNRLGSQGKEEEAGNVNQAFESEDISSNFPEDAGADDQLSRTETAANCMTLPPFDCGDSGIFPGWMIYGARNSPDLDLSSEIIDWKPCGGSSSSSSSIDSTSGLDEARLHIPADWLTAQSECTDL